VFVSGKIFHASPVLVIKVRDYPNAVTYTAITYNAPLYGSTPSFS